MQSRQRRCCAGVEPRFCARHRARNPLPPPCPPRLAAVADSLAANVAPGSVVAPLPPAPVANAPHLSASYTTAAEDCRSRPLTLYVRSSSFAPLPLASARSSIVDIASASRHPLERGIFSS